MGGAPRSLAFLISNLDKNLYEPAVLIPQRPGNEAVKQLFLESGATVIEERHLRAFNGSTVCPCNSLSMACYYLMAALPTFISTLKHVRRLKPQIVHLNSSCLFMSAAGARWGRRSVKNIVHIREPLQPNWWGKILAIMNRKYADAFVSIDRYGLSTMSVGKQPCFVIPNFVDPDVYRPGVSDRSEFRTRLGCTETDVLFLYMARVAPSNGAFELASFLAKYQRRLPENAKFAICGFDEKTTDYSNQTLKAIRQNSSVHAMPFTSQVVQLIDSADVVVAPFVTPHNARMVIEGSAMQKPCLVADVENLKEQILPGVTGFVFRFDQPESLLNHITELCNQPDLLSQMGLESRKFAVKNYNDKVNSKRTFEVYQKLLK